MRILTHHHKFRLGNQPSVIVINITQTNSKWFYKMATRLPFLRVISAKLEEGALRTRQSVWNSAGRNIWCKPSLNFVCDFNHCLWFVLFKMVADFICGVIMIANQSIFVIRSIYSHFVCLFFHFHIYCKTKRQYILKCKVYFYIWFIISFISYNSVLCDVFNLGERHHRKHDDTLW